MTQRVALATVIDRLAIDDVITGYAVTVDDGDWSAYEALFTPDGRADYTGAGGAEGPAGEIARWLTGTMRLFPIRQHLIVNRRIDLEDLGGYPGDRARVRADYLNPMRLAREGESAESGGTAPDFVSGGRYVFELDRMDPGWRIRTVTVHAEWRRAPGPA